MLPAPTTKDIPLSFELFGLAKPILAVLPKLGLNEPTPIQSKAIPAALDGRDIVGLAQTGTGKTAAFALPIVHKLQAQGPAPKNKRLRALILSPTRELAAQIHESVRNYSARTNLRVATIVGGVSYRVQKNQLQQGVDILIATPGRLQDMLKQNALTLDDVQMVVLDEADQMLDIGFLPAIKEILNLTPTERQTLLFSATMPKEIRKLSNSHLHQPLELSVPSNKPTADKIEQRVISMSKAEKIEAISDVLLEHEDKTAIVFTRTKRGADKVAKRLGVSGIKAQAIHGNKSHNQRERALKQFKKGACKVLVATDIAARGIDVPGVGLVVNYELPEVAESYVHRIGRTARAGASGLAISFCDPEERPYLGLIQRLVQLDIPAVDLEGEEVEIEIPRGAPPKRNQRRGRGGPPRGGRNRNGGGGRDGQNKNSAPKNGPRKGGKPQRSRKPRRDAA
jgi:ATP-dependent RNA helicase RhlE